MLPNQERCCLLCRETEGCRCKHSAADPGTSCCCSVFSLRIIETCADLKLFIIIKAAGPELETINIKHRRVCFMWRMKSSGTFEILPEIAILSSEQACSVKQKVLFQKYNLLLFCLFCFPLLCHWLLLCLSSLPPVDLFLMYSVVKRLGGYKKVRCFK